MGVYIEGMEMPKKQILAVINPNGLVEVLDGNTLIAEFEAVHVQPHGRLIDADALLEHMKTEADNFKPLNMYDDGLLAGYNAATRTIRENAPTIIPASEDGE